MKSYAAQQTLKVRNVLSEVFVDPMLKITLVRSLTINIRRRRKMQAAPKMITYLYKDVCFFATRKLLFRIRRFIFCCPKQVSLDWDATVSQFADMRVHKKLERTDNQNYCMARFMSRLLRKGTCKHQVTTEILYSPFYQPDMESTHPFDSTRRTKLSFVAQWDSEKRSSSTEVKISANILSGTTSMSKSRNMAWLYVPWSRENVIASAAYQQFSSLVERGKMRCENPQRPLGSYN